MLIFSMMAGTLIRRVIRATLSPKTRDSDEKHGESLNTVCRSGMNAGDV
jgi:hypothetical protein